MAGNQIVADLTLPPAGHMIGSIVGSGGITFANTLVDLYADFTYPSYLNLYSAAAQINIFTRVQNVNFWRSLV